MSLEISKTKIKELMGDSPSIGNAEVRLRNPKKTGTITVRGYIGTNGVFRPFIDENGQERVVRIKRTMYLNLENNNDRLAYEHIRLHPIYVLGANPLLTIVNHETEADAFVAKKDLEARAMEIIQKLNGSELRDFARILLVTVKPGSSDQVVKRVLYEKATTDPGLIINEWDNDLREYKSVVRKGLEQGIFTAKHGRFMFNDQLMGTSFDGAVDWLKANDDLIPSLNKKMK